MISKIHLIARALAPFSLVVCGLALAPVSTNAAIVAGSKNIGAVWFIGDSITQSNADGDTSGSPRKSLYDKLNTGGYTYSYTGHSTSDPGGLPSDAAYLSHSGVSGATIGANLGGRTDITAGIPGWWSSGRLATVKPNVILIMIGTNDTDINLNVTTAPDRLTTLVNTIYAQPGIGNPTIFLASIPPNKSSTAANDRVIAFNAAIPGIVTAFQNQGKDVYFVDQYSTIDANRTGLMGDNLHTNAAGNDALAQNWYNAIQSRVNIPEPSSSLIAWVGATGLLALRRRKN